MVYAQDADVIWSDLDLVQLVVYMDSIHHCWSLTLPLPLVTDISALHQLPVPNPKSLFIQQSSQHLYVPSLVKLKCYGYFLHIVLL